MDKDNNTWIWAVLALVLLVISGTGGYTMMGYGMSFGFIFMALFWGAIIWLIVFLINMARAEKREDPMLTAKRRYASGELSKKQYEEIKKELRH